MQTPKQVPSQTFYRLAQSRSVYFRMPDEKTIETIDFETTVKRSEIKFSPDKKEIVMDISKDGTILLSIIKPVELHFWDTNTGEIVTKIPITLEYHTCRLSNDKKQVIALANNKKLHFINVETGAIDREIEGANNAVTCNYSADEKYVATVYYGDAAIKLYDTATGELVSTMLGHSNPPRSIVVAEDGKVISGGPDKMLRIWDGKSGKELKCLPQVDWVWDIVVSGNFILVNNRVAVGLWNLDSLQLVGLLPAFQLNYSFIHLYSDTREVLGITNKELHWFTF